jgi:hypothetical protein
VAAGLCALLIVLLAKRVLPSGNIFIENKLYKYYLKMIKASGEFALSKHPCW